MVKWDLNTATIQNVLLTLQLHTTQQPLMGSQAGGFESEGESEPGRFRIVGLVAFDDGLQCYGGRGVETNESGFLSVQSQLRVWQVWSLAFPKPYPSLTRNVFSPSLLSGFLSLLSKKNRVSNSEAKTPFLQLDAQSVPP